MSALNPQEARRLAESLDPEAQARADAEREQQGAQHRAEALLRETPHRRALLALDNALAEIQRLVGEITGGAQ